MDFEQNRELAEWLEAGLRKMFELKPSSIALVASLETGETLTGYYHADAQQKAMFAHHINSDAMLDVVLNNIGLVRDALDELDDADRN